MNNKKRPGIQAVVAVVSILLLLVAGGITWYFLTSKKEATSDNSITNTVQNANNNTNESSTSQEDTKKTEWSTYVSELYKYSFSYPSNNSVLKGPFEKYEPLDVQIYNSKSCEDQLNPLAALPRDCYHLYVHAEKKFLSAERMGITNQPGVTEEIRNDLPIEGKEYTYSESADTYDAYVKIFNATETYTPQGSSVPIYLNIIMATGEDLKEEAFEFFDEVLNSLRISSQN